MKDAGSHRILANFLHLARLTTSSVIYIGLLVENASNRQKKTTVYSRVIIFVENTS